MRRAVTSIISALAFFTMCQSASAFDCAKAYLPVDFVICSAPDVLKANEQHEKAWVEARAQLDEVRKKELLTNQRQWLKQFPPTCDVPAKGKRLASISKEMQQCVAKGLVARAAFLEQYAKGAQPTATQESSPARSDSQFDPSLVQRLTDTYERNCTGGCVLRVDGQSYEFSQYTLSPKGDVGLVVTAKGSNPGSAGDYRFIVHKTSNGWKKIFEPFYANIAATITNGYYDLDDGKGDKFIWNGSEYVSAETQAANPATSVAQQGSEVQYHCDNVRTLVNDYPVRGSEVYWSGECKDGQADGRGVARWYKDGLLNYLVDYTESYGLVRSEGRTTAVAEIIDKNVTLRIDRCDKVVGFRLVRVETKSLLALSDGTVVGYIFGKAQQLAWDECPSVTSFGNQVMYSNVAVTISTAGRDVVIARSYKREMFQPESLNNLNWQEYRNIALEERFAMFDQKFNAEVNARQQEQNARRQEELRAQQEEVRRQQEFVAKALAARREEFEKSSAIAQWVESDELNANPFRFKGQIVGVFSRFKKMISENEAMFGAADPKFDGSDVLIIGKVPSTTFSTAQGVALAVRVVGMRPLKTANGETNIPDLEFVGLRFCSQSGCF